MGTTYLILVLVAVAAMATTLWWKRHSRRWARRTVEDFAQRFPGRCFVCSYHRFGLQEGCVRGPVKPHDCIEGKTWKKPSK